MTITGSVADQEQQRQPQRFPPPLCSTNSYSNSNFTTNTAVLSSTPTTSATTTAINISPSHSTSIPLAQSPCRHIFSRRLLTQLRHHARRFHGPPISNHFAPNLAQISVPLEDDLSPASASDLSSSPQFSGQESDAQSSSSSSVVSTSSQGLVSFLSDNQSSPTADPGSCPIANFSLHLPTRLEVSVRSHRLEEKSPPSFRMTRNSGDQMAATSESQQPSIRFIPFHDPRASRPSLTFQALSRTLPSADSIIKVGRYSERDAQPGDMPRGMPSSAPVGFKSKVVSRRHCEFWCEGLQWWVKDVKSSSGTFLNHLRLSPPGVESKPWKVNDGDVIQLGIDFRGGEEMIFRCVKIRIELNRGWQKALNNFNKSTHRRIRKLQEPSPRRDSDNASMSSSECAICLMGVLPCQSLFVAPCSHVWHYKCIRPILTGPGYPQFLCPNCRAVTDLEADIEEAESDWEEDLKEAIAASKTEPAEQASNNGPNGPDTSLHGVDINGDTTMADVSGPPARAAPGPPPALSITTAAAGVNGVSVSPVPAVTVLSQSHDSAQGTAAINIPSRTISPGSRRYELMTNGPTEGPQTPRNDAGPFVLDGGAGQPNQTTGSAFLGSRLNPSNATGGSAV